MAKRKTKPDTRGPLQRAYDREQVANDQSALTVITNEQRAKGTYAGERRIVNNHDPVARWIASGRLTDERYRAIQYVRRLWELSGLRQRVTANYGWSGGGTGLVEAREAIVLDAQTALRRCQSHVPPKYWTLFENVCRWGLAAGVAGDLLKESAARDAEIVARITVGIVADILVQKERL